MATQLEIAYDTIQKRYSRLDDSMGTWTVGRKDAYLDCLFILKNIYHNEAPPRCKRCERLKKKIQELKKKGE